MRHGYHMGYGFYGSDILILILIIFVVIVFLLLRNKQAENPFVIKLVDILKEKYAAGTINADEYIERKAIIEEIKSSNPYIAILLKRYALCEIDTREFFDIKNEIESNHISNSLNEKLVKGELSYCEFKAQSKKEEIGGENI